MVNKNEMSGVHPALLAPMPNTKPKKLTAVERMVAKRNLEKARKKPVKRDKEAPIR